MVILKFILCKQRNHKSAIYLLIPTCKYLRTKTENSLHSDSSNKCLKLKYLSNEVKIDIGIDIASLWLFILFLYLCTFEMCFQCSPPSACIQTKHSCFLTMCFHLTRIKTPISLERNFKYAILLIFVAPISQNVLLIS